MVIMQPQSASFEDPIALLIACHDNVRRFTKLCLRLDEHLHQSGLDADAVQAASSILRYFDLAAPLHHLDEEQDLFPALHQLGDAALNTHLASLQAEHPMLDALWHSVRPWLVAISEKKIQASPTELPTFVSTYIAHAEREETLLYPAAHLLPSDTLAQLGKHMCIRRGASA